MGSKYQFKTELSLANPQAWFNGRNSIKLDFSTPSQKTYSLETVCNIEQHSSGVKVDSIITWKTPENKMFKMNSETSMESLGEGYNFRINTKADITSPDGKQTTLTIDAKHQRTSSQRDAHMEVKV